MPNAPGLPPSVEQKQVRKEERLNRLLPLVSDRHEEALPIHQEAKVYASTLEPGHNVTHAFHAGRGGYLYVISGAIQINGSSLTAGDAAKIMQEREIGIESVEESHLLLVTVGVE